MKQFNIIQGDCLETIKTLPDNSVDSVITDPPYGLSFMSKDWDLQVPKPDVWKEAMRVLKPGGHLIAFSGTRTYHQMATAVELGGFEIRDMLSWIYGSGFPKSYNLGNKVAEYAGIGTSLKPACEPCVLARKPFDFQLNAKGEPLKSRLTVLNNVIKWGVGGLNIDASRVPYDNEEPVSTHSKKTDSVIYGKYDDLENTQSEGQLKGRFPANVIHDGSDEVIELFPEGAPRFFYSPKVSTKERNRGMPSSPSLFAGVKTGQGSDMMDVVHANNDRARGEEKVSHNNHPTVKPVALMAYLVKLITPPGGTVLDPYNGSGSTGIACVLNGYNYIGCELDQDYIDISNARIQGAIDKPEEWG